MYRFKIETKDCRDVWRSRTVLATFIKRGVKVTYRKNSVYVHLDETCAYTVVLNWMERCRWRGLLTAQKKAMAWFDEMQAL